MKTLYKSLPKNMKPNGHIKAQEAQTLVHKWLEDNGFTVAEVNNVSANGVDIVAIKNGKAINVEVKTCFYSSRAWIVKKPHRNSDYVFVVLPTYHLYIEPTHSWMKNTQKDGARCITPIVKLYELLGIKCHNFVLKRSGL